MVIKAHQIRTLLKGDYFPNTTPTSPSHTCPLRPFSIFHLHVRNASRRLPTQSTQTLPRGRREDSTPRPWAVKKGSLKSSLSPPARANGGGVGWNEEKNFLLKFVFQIVKGIERIPGSPGLRGVGGGDTPQSFNGRQGEGGSGGGGGVG